ncbi:hypothetical protein GW17_00045566 [Ensete ventricosum]|nr:hypothetical protein GW17_00045566 [Ensete ventricosum]
MWCSAWPGRVEPNIYPIILSLSLSPKRHSIELLREELWGELCCSAVVRIDVCLLYCDYRDFARSDIDTGLESWIQSAPWDWGYIMAVEVGVPFKPVRTESPLELVGNESSLELVETESPLELVGIELPLELIGTESPLELVRIESPLELIGTESPLELRVVSCHLFITCVVPNCHLALSRVLGKIFPLTLGLPRCILGFIV